MEDCDKRRIPVRLVADSLDTSTASGQLLANVLGSVAQFEAQVTSERVRAVYAARAARGDKLSNTPVYGDGEGEDIGAVVRAFNEAGSYSGAARLLNAWGVKPRGSKRGWWPSSVNVIIDRVQPQKRNRAKGYRAGGTDFKLARLLRCPTCGTMLTGIRDRGDRTRYACRLGSVMPHARVSISEHLILPAFKAEVAHLRTPDRVESETRDARETADLEARRGRVLDMYEAGDIDGSERHRRLERITAQLAAIESRRVVIDVPVIDWSWEPKSLNAVLLALFRSVELDRETFQPKPDGFVWTMPEWRAA